MSFIHQLALHILGLSITNLAEIWAVAMHKFAKPQMIIVTLWFSVKIAAIVVRWHNMMLNDDPLNISF